LNLLAAWKAWRESGVKGVLHFTSFEAFPMSPEDMKTAQNAFHELRDLSDELMAAFTAQGAQTHDLHFELITGDARETVPAWQNKADAWFLDGFSPAKNPELWGDDLMQAVGARTNVNGSFATYTAAGHVRRALESAGFKVERVAGFGRKRHMSVGVFTP